MATVQTRLNKWRIARLRGQNQVNYDVLLEWYNEWYSEFQKICLEYVANNLQTTNISINLIAWQDTYSLPFWLNNAQDFYSITQLTVALCKDKNWNPVYRKCMPISLTDYNIKESWYQKGSPIIWRRISKRNPRYSFINKSEFKIFPTPTENITAGINLQYNFYTQDVSLNTNEDTLWVPRYFLDVINRYLDFKLYEAENPELSDKYYQLFKETLYDNIHGLNRDKRPVEEEMANTSYFSHY